MNVDTGEIRDVSELTDDEKASGKWIPITKKWARKWVKKVPKTEADFARILKADERRKRRNARRLENSH